jgi:ribonuclease BN (tRNA processing enzyme)
MIFAPRSCPSRPGLAITTRIFLATVGQYMDVRLTVIGSSPAWPNPGSAQSGYLLAGAGKLLLDCGPGVLGRLRQNGARVDAIAITHWHLDHCGDLIPWAWLNAYSPEAGKSRPALWLPPGSERELETFTTFWGVPKMWERAFELREFAPGEPFEAAGFQVEAVRVRHYTMDAYGFRVRDSAGGRVLAYSGDSAPTEELSALARAADLFVCEATLADGSADAEPRGHLSVEEALAAADGPVLLTHRPVELPSPDGVPLAYDGLVMDI